MSSTGFSSWSFSLPPEPNFRCFSDRLCFAVTLFKGSAL
jgi:hypothetical protein